ncbi:MAG: cyclic nucleotide-binding domain-containing protein [Bdellovibrionota bacterium]
MSPRTAAAEKTAEIDVLASLKQFPFFKDFPVDLLKEVSQFASFVLQPAGTEILRQGSKNQNLYFLLSGSVGVYSDGDLVIHMEKFGDIIGEISVLSQTPCSASVLAETPVELIQVEAHKLLGPSTKEISDSLRSQFLRRVHRRYQLESFSATNEGVRRVWKKRAAT